MSMHEISIGGVSYKVSLPHAETDYIQGKLANTGEPYELPMLQSMASRLKPDDLVLDIGANIGNHTLYLANVAQCIVHAFEPNAALCQGLQESINANNLPGRVTVHQVGVSDTAGFATFDHLDESNLGAQSLRVQGSNTNAPIKLIKLDDLEFDRPVRMIKVDVEGMEINVLGGAINLLKTHRPTLYVEAQNVSEFEGQLGLLRGLGYLYLDTFNATPTHLYVHESYIDSAIDISRRLSENQIKSYADADVKKQLNAANLKYRDASEQIRKFKEYITQSNKIILEKEQVLKQAQHELELLRSAEQEAINAIKNSSTWMVGRYVQQASGSFMGAVK